MALLTESAPVVVAASPEKQAGMAFLITSGAVDFVARTNNYLPIVAGMLDRRVRMAERATGMIQFPKDELSGDFGEILRHEVNNQLTGIFGNTELLLARRDRLPPAAVERLGNDCGAGSALAGNGAAAFQRVGRASRACAAGLNPGTLSCLILRRGVFAYSARTRNIVRYNSWE